MNTMKTITSLAGLFLLTLSTASFAATVGEPLPPLAISQPGEIMLDGDGIGYQPWNSQKTVDKVHVVQYIPATMSASKMYRPFTDYLEENYDPSHFHVTTVIDLDAALWGTSGLVSSEVEKNKRKYPLSTLVLDKTGSGIGTWSLGKNGSGLFIVDETGIVHFAIRHKMDATEQRDAEEVFSTLVAQ